MRIGSVNISDMKRKDMWNKVAKRAEFSIGIALIIMIIIMSFASDVFLTSRNLFNILNQISRYGIIACGMTMIILSGGIDLSVGYLVALCACIFAFLLSDSVGMPDPLALLITLGLGCFVGLINGLLITKIKLIPFIVTLATGKMILGATLLLTQARPINFVSYLTWLGSGYVGPVPIPVIIMLIIVILGSIFLKRTQTGRNLYAIGNNERSAALSGINVERHKTLTYVVTGVLCAICGIVMAGNLQSAESNIGTGYEIDTIAAVVIGGVAMSGGEGTIWGALIGCAIMGVLKNAFVLLGISAYWQSIVIGIVIISAIALDRIRTKRD